MKSFSTALFIIMFVVLVSIISQGVQPSLVIYEGYLELTD